MATLRDIKRRINGVENTSKITKAMKMVAAAKLKRAQNAIIAARPYVNKLGVMMNNLIDAVGGEYAHPLLETRTDIKSIYLVVVTADRGLCGSFNSNLLRAAVSYIEGPLKEHYPDAQVSIIPVGKRGATFFAKRDYQIVKNYVDFFSNLNFNAAKDVISLAKNAFFSGKADKVIVFYNEFASVLRQNPTHSALLPFAPEENIQKSDKKKAQADYIFEPGMKEILDDLLPKYLDIKLWKMLLESNAAEQSARMVAMDNATINAKELIENLQLIYNKARQAAITKEMLEIVGGADALKG